MSILLSSIKQRLLPVKPGERPINTAELLASPFVKAVYRPVQPLIEGLFGFPRMWKIYDQAGGDHVTARELCCNALDILRTSWSLPPDDLEQLVNIRGPLVIVANHPYGGVDSLALISLLEQLRPGGWKLLSNHVMHAIPPLTPHLIPVDALGLSASGNAINHCAMRESLKFLRAGGLLAFFPARRVSHWDRKFQTVMDQPWSDHALKLAAHAGGAVACLHTPGHNGKFFLRVPLRWPRFRGLMLCRELTCAPPRTLDFRMASLLDPMEVTRMAKTTGGVRKLQARCFLEADKREFHANSHEINAGTVKINQSLSFSSEAPTTVDKPSLPLPLFADNAFDVLFFKGSEFCQLMGALGRAREITFQQAGQGVGGGIDLTPEDPYYHQLVVWDRFNSRIAGAYRIGIVSEILGTLGPRGLYLDHVFEIDPMFYRHFQKSMELSRSFVLPEYQRDNRVLPLLWRGLARVSMIHGIHTLFGSVTISNAHHPASRAILVEHLKNEYADEPKLCRLIKPRSPFVPRSKYHGFVADAHRGERISVLEPLIRSIENNQRGIPPLLRYYCQLGAKFLSFHVEKSFQNALYCLLRVELSSIPGSYRRRFFPRK